MLAHQPHAPNPGPPRGGGGVGLQRALDLPVLELVQLQGQEHGVGGDGGLARAQVALELGPRRVVAGGGGGQGGVGAGHGQQVGEPLGERHGLVDDQAEPLGVGAGGHEGALQLDQLVHRGAGGLEVDLDGRVARAVVEVRQAPLRGVCGRLFWGGNVHGHGRRMDLLGPGINAESRPGVGDGAGDGVGDRPHMGHCSNNATHSSLRRHRAHDVPGRLPRAARRQFDRFSVAGIRPVVAGNGGHSRFFQG